MKTATPKAIPTEYAGYTMRSRFEANVAEALTGVGMVWEYEPKSFLLDNGEHYMPDFYIPSQRTWIEVRGYGEPFFDQNLWYFTIRDREHEWIERLVLITSSYVTGEGGAFAYVQEWAKLHREHPWWSASVVWCKQCQKPFFYDWSNDTCLSCHYNDGRYAHLGYADLRVTGIEIHFETLGFANEPMTGQEITRKAMAGEL